MLENVVFERKNLLYEELLEQVLAQRSLVTCCIDAHFTAFQVLDNNCCVYYDPLKPRLTLVYGEQSMRKFICYLLLKCSYADNSHVQENKGHYMGPDATPIRRTIYKLWQNINTQELHNLYDVRTKPVGPNPNSTPTPTPNPDPSPFLPQCYPCRARAKKKAAAEDGGTGEL